MWTAHNFFLKFMAVLWLLMICKVPLVIGHLGTHKATRTQIMQGVALLCILFTFIYLLTCVVEFKSSHWEGNRCLTVLEAVYLMAMSVTTVGYGDIVPAYPRGQVVIGCYLILMLIIIAEMIGEATQALGQRARDRLLAMKEPMSDEQDREDLPTGRLFNSVVIYLGIALIGTLFWRFYPGEGKTFLQGVYMSVITLSTVGFGALTPVTQGGMVFAAFWMLFGVTALMNVIGNFSEYLMALKIRARKRESESNDDFKEVLEQAKEYLATRPNVLRDLRNLVQGTYAGEADRKVLLNDYQYLMLSLLRDELVTMDDLCAIEEQFDALGPTSDMVPYGTVVRSFAGLPDEVRK